MFIFELFYKEMLPRNEHLVSAINNPEIKSKLSDQTVKKITNVNVMYSTYIRKVRFYNGTPIYTGSDTDDVFRGGNDKVIGLPALKQYLNSIENAILEETK